MGTILGHGQGRYGIAGILAAVLAWDKASLRPTRSPGSPHARVVAVHELRSALFGYLVFRRGDSLAEGRQVRIIAPGPAVHDRGADEQDASQDQQEVASAWHATIKRDRAAQGKGNRLLTHITAARSQKWPAEWTHFRNSRAPPWFAETVGLSRQRRPAR